MAMTIDAGKTSRIDVFGIDPSEILRDPADNSRATPHSPEEIEALAQRIFDEGQLQPVLCRRVEQKKVRLIAGFGRVTAIDFINTHPDRFSPLPEPIKVLCRVIECSPEEAFIRSISENLDRLETNAIDDAHAQRRLREQFHWSDERIAEFYGKSVSHINKLRRLPTLEKPLQEKVASGQIAVQTAVDLADVPAPARQEIVANATDTKGKVSTAGVRKGIREHAQANGDNGKVKQRTIKEMKEFLDGLTGGDEEPAMRELGQKWLHWIAGNVSDKQMESWLEAFLNGLDGASKKGKK